MGHFEIYVNKVEGDNFLVILPRKFIEVPEYELNNYTILTKEYQREEDKPPTDCVNVYINGILQSNELGHYEISKLNGQLIYKFPSAGLASGDNIKFVI